MGFLETPEKKATKRSGALRLAGQANLEAQRLAKTVSVAVLNSSGVTIALLRGDNVGPHNTEASRRKASTALSTQTPRLELMRKAAADSTAQNLNSLPEPFFRVAACRSRKMACWWGASVYQVRVVARTTMMSLKRPPTRLASRSGNSRHGEDEAFSKQPDVFFAVPSRQDTGAKAQIRIRAHSSS